MWESNPSPSSQNLYAKPLHFILYMVGKKGFEPSHHYWHKNLNLACLPIPSLAHLCFNYLITKLCKSNQYQWRLYLKNCCESLKIILRNSIKNRTGIRGEARTHDSRLKRAVLCQLSYTNIWSW